MKYKVLDGGNDATMGTGIGWDNCVFDTFEEAVAYARQWLGNIYDDPKHDWHLNDPFNYGAYSDYMMIIDVDN